MWPRGPALTRDIVDMSMNETYRSQPLPREQDELFPSQRQDDRRQANVAVKEKDPPDGQFVTLCALDAWYAKSKGGESLYQR